MIRTLIVLFFFFSFPTFSLELKGENLLFVPPDGYQMGFSDNKNNIYISEWFPDGQTKNYWSEMVTVQVLYNYTSRNVENFVDKFIGVIVDICDNGRG